MGVSIYGINNLLRRATNKIIHGFRAGANASFNIPSKNNISLEGHLKIPNEFKETHSLFAKLIYGNGLNFIDYLLKYRSNQPLRKYGLWGEVNIFACSTYLH